MAHIAVPIEAELEIKVVFLTSSEPSSIKDIAPPRPVLVVDNSSKPQHKFSLFSNKEFSI